jgi:hypothetical protein
VKPERWAEIDQIWHAVLARPEQDRTSAVAELCHGDETLRRDVESMLAHLARASAVGFGVPGAAVVGELRGVLLGCQLGPYAVHSLLGAGGMGEVYQAYDSSLGREVAVKVLPEHWMTDPERAARFDSEARTLASLNHPNIGAIYGIHEGGGVRALVLELVEGETLVERIARYSEQSAGGLPIADVLDIAAQIAEALEASHERGIIHRDLKPANIKITSDGRVKVLDFGLALAMRRADNPAWKSGSETISFEEEGLLIGTPQYMSPEQACGRQVDKRTDIWAFGCVVYEMLTGRPAFSGGVAEVLANTITVEPDWKALPADTPPALRSCLRRCLQKDLRQRIHDMADVRLAMAGAFEPGAETLGSRRPASRLVRLVRSGWALAGALALTTAIALLASFRTPAPILQLTMPAPPPPALLPPVPTEDKKAEPPPKATPPVLLSSLGGDRGSASATTIQEAIDRAAPGAIVTVLPGTYAETLKVTKGLTLEAAAERSGPVILAPTGTPDSVIEVTTTEPVILRGLTLHVPGRSGINGVGGVEMTVLRATVIAVNPEVTNGSLIVVNNNAQSSGRRARAVIRNSTLDAGVTARPRFAARPQMNGVRLAGDVDGVIQMNIIRRAGGRCVVVVPRADLGGETNVDILGNDIDECRSIENVAAIIVGVPSVSEALRERSITAIGVINIINNTIRNSSEDCVNNAITWNVFSGRIEHNTIVNFVKPCASPTRRNEPGAVYVGASIPGIRWPDVVPSVRFNNIHGNAHAGLRIGPDQSIPIDASCNYWGSEQGPSGLGTGNGDAVVVHARSSAVPPVFMPFASSPVAGSKTPPC